jgi:hypothetical protein
LNREFDIKTLILENNQIITVIANMISGEVIKTIRAASIPDCDLPLIFADENSKAIEIEFKIAIGE